MKKLLTLITLAAAGTAAQATTPLWLRDVKISPDGDRIAFTYKGDIYTVPTKGGEATRLTTSDDYESSPVWSPDGSLIAYASDRHGNFDIFVMPSTGGTPRRLTTHSSAETPEAFSPDGKYVLYSASIQDPSQSALFPTARLSELYQVPVKGGAFTQVIATPANRIAYSPDGKEMYYQYRPGMENEWRKHHTSSVTADIWKYDAKSGKHTNLTSRPGEDRDPVVSPDGKTLYYLSERDGGSFNVYSAPVDNANKVKRLTNYSQQPVRFLSGDKKGTLAYAYDGEIYTLTPGKSPAKVKINITGAEPTDQIEKMPVRLSGGTISPDGKQLAFVSRGDVFVTSVEYPTTKQITSTPAAEHSVAWGDDRTLYYTSERDGLLNIYKATIANDSDPDFPNSTIIKEERVFDNDGVERSAPDVSPDGKKLAYIENRNQLWIKDIKTGKKHRVTDGSTYQRRNGSFTYRWSPDSRWIVFETVDNRHDPYSDIAIINVEDGTYKNITQSGYIDSNPRFVMDGNAILFATERYGMRAQASWGSQEDVMIVFLNREARDKYRMSEEELALYKEAEKKAKKTDTPASDDKKKDDKKKDDKKDADKKDTVKPINVELDGIEDRIVRLTPFSSSLADAIIDPDGENLFFLSSLENGFDLWKMNLRKRDPKIVGKIGINMSQFATDKSGKTAFILGSAPKKLDMKSDKLTPITARGTMAVDLAAEREAMLDNVYRSEKEMFYRTDMHGVDWDNLVKHYKKFLPHINNNYDYAEFLSELLGELNVSHTGSTYRPDGSSQDDRTAALGLLYDMSYTGDGLKVDEVITDGPFDKKASKMVAGSIITEINGEKITPEADYSTLFNDIAGTNTQVTFTLPGGEVVRETVKPVSVGAQNSLLYRRWIAQRAADVDRWSNGRLGYVHIASMNDASFRPMYADLLGKYNTRDGIVIDIRWNGGGRMHEDIEMLFSGKKYFTQVVRGVEACDMPSRRWNKPSIMLQSEACYSNAHGTPWVYKHRGIGKLVGAPVAGTMTSVNWITMQDPSLTYGIPVVGYRTADGSYLENSQLEPDILVNNDPATVVKGEDTQLRTAVEALLKEIDSQKSKK